MINVSLTISPVKNAEGKVVGASTIARDITERKRAEAREKMLMAELDHRVKNVLAVWRWSPCLVVMAAAPLTNLLDH